MSFNYTYGIEIEFIRPAGMTMADVANAITDRGVLCREEHYNHALRTWWKVVVDGSTGQNGCEVVSPILRGPEGLERMGKVVEALNDLGCSVNRKCGVHVHVSPGADPGLEFYRELIRLYGFYEPQIDAFMPASRRANDCYYAKTLRGIDAGALSAAGSIGEIVQVMVRNSGAEQRRYHKVNLDAIARHQTVEFRQHSASLDATKIGHWTQLCLRLVDTAIKRAAAPRQAVTVRNAARPGTKTHMAGEMMMRSGGASGPEVLRATGWPSVSMPAQARACGLAVRTVRRGREVRYYAAMPTSAVTPGSQPILIGTLDGMFAALECPTDQQDFFRLRTRNLGGATAWVA